MDWISKIFVLGPRDLDMQRSDATEIAGQMAEREIGIEKLPLEFANHVSQLLRSAEDGGVSE
ncbi:MAG: hypothetical protein GY937_13360 [bacterium]|nr:hypothetical protein [bacterium]